MYNFMSVMNFNVFNEPDICFRIDIYLTYTMLQIC